jgi:hypothetical protein
MFVVYTVLNCDIMFDGQGGSNTQINLLYSDVNRNFHVITNLRGAMAKLYICNGCNKWCKHRVTRKCDVSYSDHMFPTQIAEFHVTRITDISEEERVVITIK